MLLEETSGLYDYNLGFSNDGTPSLESETNPWMGSEGESDMDKMDIDMKEYRRQRYRDFKMRNKKVCVMLIVQQPWHCALILL